MVLVTNGDQWSKFWPFFSSTWLRTVVRSAIPGIIVPSEQEQEQEQEHYGLGPGDWWMLGQSTF